MEIFFESSFFKEKQDGLGRYVGKFPGSKIDLIIILL